MHTWAKIALVIILLILGAGALHLEKQPKVSISCKARLDSGSCDVENKGGTTADIDANVVFVCRDGEHMAHVSARVESNSLVTKIIDGFEPPVGLLSTCAGINYRDFLVRKTE